METLVKFDVSGPPLSDIVTGFWDLQMRDGSTLFAVVDRGEDGQPWWAKVGEPGAQANCSTDWSMVSGAVMVSLEEAALRAPGLGLPAQMLSARPDRVGVSISGRARPCIPVEVTARAISLSDEHIAALLAVRSVIADSAHPGKVAALEALAKLGEATDLRVINGCTVNVHAFADDFATVCGCGNTMSGPPVVPPKRVMS